MGKRIELKLLKKTFELATVVPQHGLFYILQEDENFDDSKVLCFATSKKSPPKCNTQWVKWIDLVRVVVERKNYFE